MSLLFLSVYEFNEEDLRSNQRGVIAPGQKKWLDGMAEGIRKSQSGALKWGVFFLFFGMCVILGMFLSVGGYYRTELLTRPMTFLPLFLTVPVVLGILVLSMFFANRRADRLANSELSVAEGRAELDETHSSKYGSAYYVTLGNVRFAFPESVSAIFKEGETYRIYYCETSMLKLILSYEKIG